MKVIIIILNNKKLKNGDKEVNILNNAVLKFIKFWIVVFCPPLPSANARQGALALPSYPTEGTPR